MRRFGVLLMAGLAALLGAAELDVNIHPLGGNVRGFGVLAEYPAGGTEAAETGADHPVPGRR